MRLQSRLPRVLQVHVSARLSLKDAFLLLAARWCCRIGKCVSASGAGSQSRVCSGHCCWRTGLSLRRPCSWLRAGAAGSRGVLGGAGRRRAGEPRQCWGGLGVTSNLHRFFLPRENQLTGDPSISCLLRRYGGVRQYGWKFPTRLCHIAVPFAASRTGGEGQFCLEHGGRVYMRVIKITDIIML